MRKPALLFLTLSMSFPLASAQSTPWWELYGAYQYTRADTGDAQNALNLVTTSNGLPQIEIGSRQNLNGWNVSLQENAASWWGGIIDISGTYETKRIDLTQAALAAGVIAPGQTAAAKLKPSLYTYAGGPQFTYRAKQIQPFVRLMLGGAEVRGRSDFLVNNAVVSMTRELSENGFALIAGGGADYVWKDFLSFRVAGDYVRTYLFSETQKNFRVSAGLNFRIGRK
jgi:hypothetical protein